MINDLKLAKRQRQKDAIIDAIRWVIFLSGKPIRKRQIRIHHRATQISRQLNLYKLMESPWANIINELHRRKEFLNERNQ